MSRCENYMACLYIDEANDEIKRLKEIISEIHSWAVCAAICSADDLCQNIDRIITITDPTYKGDTK